MNTRKPDFFIVGAAKAGTTALYSYLSQHPEVYMSPIKEPNYFSKDVVLEHLRPQVKKRLEAENLSQYFKDGMNRILHRAYIRDEQLYLQLFSSASPDVKAGEASASYLYSSVAANEIKKFNPAAKIIIILREPAARAYSHYLMDLKLGFVKSDFANALAEDAKAEPKGWGASSLYKELGLYAEQVERYLSIFPKEQVLILLYDDLKKDEKESLRKIYHFLGINEEFIPDKSGFRNESAVPSGTIARLLLRSGSIRVKMRNLLENTPLKPLLLKILYKKPILTDQDSNTIRQLQQGYKNDIQKLSALIQRDLQQWLK
jgi:hypothetical protein